LDECGGKSIWGCDDGRAGAANAEVVDGVLKVAGLEVGGLGEKAAGCDDLIDDEAGLVGCELEAFFDGDFADDEVEGIGGKGNPGVVAFRLEDAASSSKGMVKDLPVWRRRKS